MPNSLSNLNYNYFVECPPGASYLFNHHRQASTHPGGFGLDSSKAKVSISSLQTSITSTTSPSSTKPPPESYLMIIRMIVQEK